MSKNFEKINDELIQHLFNPLNENLQELQSDFSSFQFFNHKSELLGVAFSEKILLKVRMERNIEEGSFSGLKIEIFSQSGSKIDEEVIVFLQPINIIKKGPSLNTYINEELDENFFQVEVISNYIAQWLYFFNISEIN